jgi:hypothetical protein
MTRRVWLIGTLLLASTSALSASQVLAAHPASISLKAVNLQLSDVPSGYRSEVSKIMTAADAAASSSVSASVLQHHGYASGYENEYIHVDKKGRVLIGSFTLLFRSVADATWAYPYSQKSLATTHGASHASASTVGNTSAAYHVVAGSGASLVSGYGLVFRRGAVVAGFAAYGSGRSYGTVSQIVGLAKIVDKRIQAAK